MLFRSLASLAIALVGTEAAESRTWSTVYPSLSDVEAAAATIVPSSPTSNVDGCAFKNFYIIWLENTDFDKAAESEGLSWLAQYGITLDNYWAVTHPSEPNYVASVAGDYFALDNDDFVVFPSNVSTLYDLLAEKNISAGEYQEHMPYAGFQGYNFSNQETYANDYMRKHNPFVSFASVTDDDDRLFTIKNFTDFTSDLEAGTLPQWAFITPNMTNDAHDSNINVAADWSKNWIGPLLNNSAFMEDTLILLTFDENENYYVKNKVFALLLGGAVPEELWGTVDSTFYDHYSELATSEANWNLYNLGRHDADANVFDLVARQCGVTNREVDTTYKVNNYTYVGYYNDDDIDLPAPNVSATNLAGMPILPAISSAWADKFAEQVSDGYFTSTTTTVSSSIGDATLTTTWKSVDTASVLKYFTGNNTESTSVTEVGTLPADYSSSSVEAAATAVDANSSNSSSSSSSSAAAAQVAQVAGFSVVLGFLASLII